MRIPPVMPETGRADTTPRHPSLDREALLSRAFCGGLDTDILLERLFDSFTERRP